MNYFRDLCEVFPQRVKGALSWNSQRAPSHKKNKSNRPPWYRARVSRVTLRVTLRLFADATTAWSQSGVHRAREDLPRRDIIVIGGSAGALEVLATIISQLPRDLPAAVFVVLHMSPGRESKLRAILSRAGRLIAIEPVDKQKFESGRIYVAPPDRHLMIEDHHLSIGHGPKENRSRPAIDPLFRSAALAHGPRVIGIVLSGSLDDGTAGLWAIKNRGGIAIVQDPAEALYNVMPQSAIDNNSVDYILPVREIAPALRSLVGEEIVEEGAKATVKDDLEKELEVLGQRLDSEEMIENVEQLGTTTMFTCPECHGTLWEIKQGELSRYRCHVGHAFSIESLDAAQAEKLEGALWSALRALEERVALARQLANQARERNAEYVASGFDRRADETSQHAETIRGLLFADPEHLITEADERAVKA